MKPQLLAIKSALAGPNATAVSSRMVKLQDNRIWAYGGAFCLSVPYPSTLSCGFMPEMVLAFFSVDRSGHSFTERDGKLILSHNNKEFNVARVLPAHEIPSLAVVGPLMPTPTLQNLDRLMRVHKAGFDDFRQGVCFKNQTIFAANQSTVAAVDGFIFGHDEFVITAEAVKALATIDSGMTGVRIDQIAVQFEFDDGTILTARKLDGLTTPDFIPILTGDESTAVELSEETIADILAFRLAEEGMDMVWIFDGLDLHFVAPDDSTGIFRDVVEAPLNFRIKGEVLRTILSISTDLHLMALNGRFNRLAGYGDGYAVAGALSRE